METRQEKLLACLNPIAQLGIEIGPLNRPIVTCEMGEIRYVDHETTAGLRAKYASDQNVDISKIVDVDYVWGEKRLSELVEQEAPFDYVLASHVIEHVPDLIGWLRDIAATLRPGGILSLAIPDKRQCFDYTRNPTRANEVIEVYLQGARKPSPRQIFDHLASAVSWQGQISWAHQPSASELVPVHSEAQAWEVAQTAVSTDRYIDVHCWVFSPASFFALLKVLIQLDLFDFKVEQFFETTGCEFFVSLATFDPSIAAEERRSCQLASLPTLPSLDSTSALAQPTATQHHIEAIAAQLAATQQQLAVLNEQFTATQQAMQAMQNSRSWQITQPLRWANQTLVRLTQGHA